VPLVNDSRPPFLFMFLTDLTVSSLLSNHLTLWHSSWAEGSLGAGEESTVASGRCGEEFSRAGEIETHHLEGKSLIVQGPNDFIVWLGEEGTKG
jgi:hypothetical protein